MSSPGDVLAQLEEKDKRIRSLEAERDALKARVAELRVFLKSIEEGNFEDVGAVRRHVHRELMKENPSILEKLLVKKEAQRTGPSRQRDQDYEWEVRRGNTQP